MFSNLLFQMYEKKGNIFSFKLKLTILKPSKFLEISYAGRITLKAWAVKRIARIHEHGMT